MSAVEIDLDLIAEGVEAFDPYRIRSAPGSAGGAGSRSITVTGCPVRASMMAAAIPATPPPRMTTRCFKLAPAFPVRNKPVWPPPLRRTRRSGHDSMASRSRTTSCSFSNGTAPARSMRGMSPVTSTIVLGTGSGHGPTSR